jgi:5-methylcytosine-specific restriction protein A
MKPPSRKPWAKGPDAPPRLTGRKAVERRRRWLAGQPLCVHCEREGWVRPGQVLDHIVPLAQGGADDETNFQTLCRKHHHIKSVTEKGGTPKKRSIGRDGWPIE